MLDPILPRVGVHFSSSTSSASGVVLPGDPIERLGLDLTQEPVLAGLVNPENPLNILLALPPAHYMERTSHGSNEGDRGSFSMHVHFTEILGRLLGANIMIGLNVVFNVDNFRVVFVESDYHYNR